MLKKEGGIMPGNFVAFTLFVMPLTKQSILYVLILLCSSFLLLLLLLPAGKHGKIDIVIWGTFDLCTLPLEPTVSFERRRFGNHRTVATATDGVQVSRLYAHTLGCRPCSR